MHGSDERAGNEIWAERYARSEFGFSEAEIENFAEELEVAAG